MRGRSSRELLLVVSLFALLAGLTAWAALRRTEFEQNQQVVSYSSRSAADSGTLALKLWLEALGYVTERIENRAFEIRRQTRLLFIIGPREPIEDIESHYLLDWVSRGNTLVMAGTGLNIARNFRQVLQVELRPLGQRAERARLVQPLLDASVSDALVNTTWGLWPSRSDYVPFLQAFGQSVLIRLKYGGGTIWLSSAPNLFTNSSLRDASTASLVAALVRESSLSGQVAFDEYHLGYKPQAQASLQLLVYNTPWGWAFIYSLLLTLAYLLLGGQRLGSTRPLPRAVLTRNPAEYVVSMANLFRRAGKRGMVLNHYRRTLKRKLGGPFHLDPDLPDDVFVETVARLRDDLDRAELQRTIASLRHQQASERELVQTAAHAVQLAARPRASSNRAGDT